MGDQSWTTRGSSFGTAAEVYDRTRPSYPREALDWALGDRQLAVLDLGAGTGQLTRQLVAAGHQAIAVEPDEAMRARLAETTPAAVVHGGSAEAIPLPDASVDAVLASHSYHWFRPEPAHAEIARVLRPGGVLAALWNLRDEAVPWSAELSRILRDEDTGVDHDTPAAIMLHGVLEKLQHGDRDGLRGWLRAPSFGDDFGPVDQGFFPNSSTLTVDSLVELLRSRSYYLTATPERQAELEQQVRQLVATHPDLAGRDEFEMPYVTVVFRANRRP